jgi:type VI secretion system secreted protein VgrG
MTTATTNRTLSVSGPALATALDGGALFHLSGIDGSEHLSCLYEYRLMLHTADDLPMSDIAAANLDLKAMLGKELTVTIELDGMGAFVPGLTGIAGVSRLGAGTREISGIVTQAQFAGQENRRSRYQLVLQPWLCLAAKRSDYRIFQNRTVIEIVDEVLATYAYPYDKRLSDTYPKLAYQVQYGETDFAFVQRLMEEHGIYWFFEHSARVHRLVLVDHVGAHRPVQSAAYQTLPYYPPGHKIDREYIDHFTRVDCIQPGCWTSGDFDFEKPQAQLVARTELPQQTTHNALEIYEWPGDFTDRAAGERLARVRMEALHARGERAQGSGHLRNVVCGTTFTLQGFAQHAANREYLVTGASFEAREADQASGTAGFRIRTEFNVQPSSVVFRAERSVSKPHTRGPQTAIVTGPAGHEIWTDQYGRVKVKFHWDRSAARDQNSSCWIRVSYPWAGSNFGCVNVPRVGTEVIVDFESGDPDRPIVTGCVYNAATMPPWDLPANATQSGMLSRSLQGHDGKANAIRFEDRSGHEELWLQAERNMRTEVENDLVTSVLRDEAHEVNANRNKTVGGNEVTRVQGTRTETVTGDEQVTLRARRTLAVTADSSVTVGGNATSSVAGDAASSIAGNCADDIGGSHALSVTANSTRRIGGIERLVVGSDCTARIGGVDQRAVAGDQRIQIGAAQSIEAAQSISIAAGTRLILACGQSRIEMDSSGNIRISGVNVTATGSSTHKTTGATVISAATGEHTVEGAVLKLNC